MVVFALPRLLIPVESTPGENRVAATPDTVKKFISLGCSVAVEHGAGTPSGYLDEAYAEQGAFVSYRRGQPPWPDCARVRWWWVCFLLMPTKS